MVDMKQQKLSHDHHTGTKGKRRYSFYPFSTSALDGGEWLASRPDRALAPGKGPRYPLYRRLVWAPEPVWTQKATGKILYLCRGSESGNQVCSQALYWLSYHSSDKKQCQIIYSEEFALVNTNIGKFDSVVFGEVWARLKPTFYFL
jgi:hypothetical protein